jgi:flagellin
MNSIQTNVNSLIAQENLQVTNAFQTKTIEQLTSGYRINSSSDDAAGLAVANQYRDQTAELTQGVRNANDGTSQLQIMDGGLNNISQMLDRLQTLATESASTTFTGDRSTLNTEYQGLLTEIDRQADNIGLGANNSSNLTTLGVYIGGGQNSDTNSAVNVNLNNSGVGAAALGLAQTSVLTTNAVAFTIAGGTTPSAQVATAVTSTDSANFTVNTASGTKAISVNVKDGGTTLESQMGYLNTQLRSLGVSASLNATGNLQFTSATAFSVNATAVQGVGSTNLAGSGNLVDGTTAAATGDVANNTGLNQVTYALNGAAVGKDIQITEGNNTVTATLPSEVAAGAAFTQADVTAINTALQNGGITDVSAVLDQTVASATGTSSTNISFQGSSAFSIADDSGAQGVFTTGQASSAAPATTAGTDPQVAINAITDALASLGQTQGKVGAAENTINYAVNLAQSQITNFSSAESQIRDADIATEAANLSKAQVLQQSSMAAMAQANSAPQAVLKLLQ